jgi:hypothetical protein
VRKLLTGLLAGFIVITLSACGGSDKKAATSSDSANSTTGGSASDSSSDNKVSGDFCQQLASIDPVEIANDPTGAKEAAAALKKLDPPSEIAAQWSDYLKAIDEISTTNPNDNAALAGIAQRHAQSFAAVGAYISQSCLNAFSGSIPSN